MLELPAGCRRRGQPKHPVRAFRDRFPDLHRYYCGVALLMLEASREARRRRREGVTTQEIFRERFRELDRTSDFEYRVRTFQRWFDAAFLKENSTRPKIRSYFMLTTRGRRRRIL